MNAIEKEWQEIEFENEILHIGIEYTQNDEIKIFIMNETQFLRKYVKK